MILPWTWTATAAISTCETTNGDSKSPRGGGTQIATCSGDLAHTCRAEKDRWAGQRRSRERAAGERVAENLLAVRWATHAAIMVDHSRSVDQSLLRAVHSRLPRMIRQATADKLRKKKAAHSNCLKSAPPFPFPFPLPLIQLETKISRLGVVAHTHTRPA